MDAVCEVSWSRQCEGSTPTRSMTQKGRRWRWNSWCWRIGPCGSVGERDAPPRAAQWELGLRDCVFLRVRAIRLFTPPYGWPAPHTKRGSPPRSRSCCPAISYRSYLRLETCCLRHELEKSLLEVFLDWPECSPAV